MSKKQIEQLAMIAHEFNMPIGMIASTARLTERYYDMGQLDKEKLNEYMQSIVHYCNRITCLTNNIIDIAHYENKSLKCNCEALNMTDFLNALIENLDSYFNKYNVDFKFNSKISNPDTYSDFTKLERILLNLFSNAIKYTDKKTKKIIFTVSDDETFFTLSVKDKGIGIPREMIGQITNSFTRIENPQARIVEGCGLGLSIVNQFVEILNGEMQIESTVGKGSEFIIKIPRNQKKPNKISESMSFYQLLKSNIDIQMSNL